MRPNKSAKLDRRHPEAAREPMEDIRNISGDPKAVQNDIRYMESNRDRARGDADRTGRHFDAETIAPQTEEEDATDASEKHETD